MAKLSITFDSPREEAAAASIDPAYFDQMITDYLRNVIEAQALAVLRSASDKTIDSVLALVEAEKATQDAAKAAAAQALADAAVAAQAASIDTPNP